MKTSLLTAAVAGGLCAEPGATSAQDAAVAAKAVNSLGLELLVKGTPPAANALLSPYSIQVALAMTYAGAAGQTRTEMAGVLHYPPDEAALHGSFKTLQQVLDNVVKASVTASEQAKKWGGTREPLTLAVANRLYGQRGYEFRPAFMASTSENYGAPLELLDFVADPMKCRSQINGWVEQQTHERIRDLIPPDGLDKNTRLVLVNAIYMKAPWIEPFPESATQSQPFHLGPNSAAGVPTMRRQAHFGYARQNGFTAVTVPYINPEIQFLVILPDETAGLSAVEAKLTPEVLGSLRSAPSTDVILYLPKFKMEPPVFRLGKTLQALGMRSAFNVPPGSANFDRMAPRRPDDYLYISEVFHKTFISLDEKGTEAAAATAVAMAKATAVMRPAKPIEVRVDHPYLFAIQHRASGACLFLGRMTDPR